MPQSWHIEDGVLLVRKVCVGPLENNVYIVACAGSGRAVVIDASAEADRILAAAAGLRVEAVLATHGHLDHVGAARQVCDALGVPFRLHPADGAVAGLDPDDPLSDGEEITVGAVTLSTVLTPGHTPGSVCFTTGNCLFSGDTLFPGGPGATGGPGEFAAIMASLRDRVFSLPDHTLVLPGHGLDTTIGTERPSLPEWERRGY